MNTIKLNIDKPCHENWGAMTPTQQGRFCNACAKEVVDFTVMSDNEVFKTMLRSNNDICGRFFNTQLDTAIKYKAEKKQYWRKYFFSLFIPAFLFSKQSSAQKKVGKVACSKPVNNSMMTGGVSAIVTSADLKNISPVSVEKLLGKIEPVKALEEPIIVMAGQVRKRIIVEKKFELSGSVIDSNTLQKISASVLIKNNKNGTKTDNTGNFKLTGKSTDNIVSLVVSAIGYETKEMNISIPVSGFKMSDIVFHLKPYVQQLDTVVISSYNTQRRVDIMGGLSYGINIHRNAVTDTIKQVITKLADSLKVYPNPVTRGNVINVDLKLKPQGNYILQIMDITGKIVFQKQIKPIAKKHYEQVQTDNRWSSGIYVIRVIDSKTKLISVSRFVVE